jgi:hypothetical protein
VDEQEICTPVDETHEFEPIIEKEEEIVVNEEKEDVLNS